MERAPPPRRPPSLRFYGRTRREAHQKLIEAQRNLQRGIAPTDDRLTVGQFLDRWLQDAQGRVRPKTYSGYASVVDIHLKPSIGRLTLSRLSPADVQDLLNHKRASGLSPRTVEIIRAVLRQALGRAVRWGVVPRNVATLVDLPIAPRAEIQPLSPTQARAFLDSVKGDRLEALYAVAVALGMRQGEILGLCWEDVDLQAGTIRVRRALQRIGGTLQFVEPKSSRSHRTIRTPATLARMLRMHRARQLEERLVGGAEWNVHDLVFVSTTGTPLDSRGVTRRFQAALQQAGLPRLRFHDLRHTCASLLLAQGVQPRVVMEILGHSQFSLTMDTYAHVMPSLEGEAADRMDAILASR